MNNLGQLMTRYKWINSGKGTVKVDSNQDTYSSNSYTIKIRNRNIQEADTCTEPSVKPLAMDSSLYVLGLGKKCTSNDTNPVSSIVKAPLPGN